MIDLYLLPRTHDLDKDSRLDGLELLYTLNHKTDDAREAEKVQAFREGRPAIYRGVSEDKQHDYFISMRSLLH